MYLLPVLITHIHTHYIIGEEANPDWIVEWGNFVLLRMAVCGIYIFCRTFITREDTEDFMDSTGYGRLGYGRLGDSVPINHGKARFTNVIQ